jgi:hypothetical protein
MKKKVLNFLASEFLGRQLLVNREKYTSGADISRVVSCIFSSDDVIMRKRLQFSSLLITNLKVVSGEFPAAAALLRGRSAEFVPQQKLG